MKKLTGILLMITIFSLSNHAQVITDKDAFAEAFARIYSGRGDGFDSLYNLMENVHPQADKILPKANEWFVSDNNVFGAQYHFTDSLKGLAFFRELKSLLRYTARKYNNDIRYRNVIENDTFYQAFHFLDSSGYSLNFNTIHFWRIDADDQEEEEEEDDDDDDDDDLEEDKTKEKKAGKPSVFEISLLLHPGNGFAFYTRYGDRLQDPEVQQFVKQVAFGTDTALKQIRTNPRINKNETTYDSKINIRGFKTSIVEIKAAKKTGINTLLSQEYITTEENFLQNVDIFIQKLKAALPDDYVMEFDQEAHVITFQPSIFAVKKEKAATLDLSYEKVEDKKDTYKMELGIYRQISGK